MNKTMLKLGCVLALFSGVACVGLAFVHSLTAEKIAAHAQSALENALGEIFPGADSFDDVTGELSSLDERITIVAAYAIKKGGNPVGIAVQATGPSYNGEATLLSGFSADKKVVRVVVLDLKDTPGLGANAANASYYVDRASRTTFPGQFSGKDLGDAFEAKKDVVAITASTITSRSLAAIVKASGEAAMVYFAKGGH
ncbi:MAG: FMN-binding protein [Spirochaetales bacterium]|jgi:electron transport complex protein RnfG|nr:FMN-binding protein [Spirochaetales bacterium]